MTHRILKPATRAGAASGLGGAAVAALAALLLLTVGTAAAETSRLQSDAPAAPPAARTGDFLPTQIPDSVLTVAPGAASDSSLKVMAGTSPAPAAAPPVVPAAPKPVKDKTVAAPVTVHAAAATPAKTDTPAAGAKPGVADKMKQALSGGPRSDIQITSDAMDMDLATHMTTFLGHVEVVDGRMRLLADKMVVLFGNDDKPQKIEATGNVSIVQPQTNRTAKAGKAEYDVAKGSILLTEQPTLVDGKHALSGADEIEYLRDAQTLRTRGGRPVWNIIPDNTDKLNELDILGGGKKKDGN